MEKQERLDLIRDDLKRSAAIFTALGDENRQKIILVLLDNCVDGGVRVEEIAERVNLSRPAVSHHLKTLKDLGLCTVVKEGTKNYYHVSGDVQLDTVQSLVSNIERYLEERRAELK